MQKCRPQEPLMAVYVTPNEVIALGHVMTQYLTQVERTPNKTKEQLEMMALLRSFQGRIVYTTQHQSMTRSSMEAKK